MNKKTIWHIVGVGVLAAAIVAGITFVTNAPTVEVATQTQTPTTTTVFVTIENHYTDQAVELEAEQTVLAALQKLDAADPTLNLKTEKYAGLGTLVTQIGTLGNGTDNEYWQYTVNKTMPDVGADQFTVHDNDTIEWFFAPAAF